MISCLKGTITSITTSTSTTFNPDEFLKQGHIWVAPVWNHKQGRFTPRPVVLVGNDEAHDAVGLIINFITTQGARDRFDVPVEYWRESGLDDPSWMRTAKPTTIVKLDLRRDPVSRDGVIKPKGYIGKLHNDDLAKVLTMCKSIF